MPDSSPHSNKSGGSNAAAPSSAAPPRRMSRKASQRSSIFRNARMSFVRSGGQRGASIETLRGTTGADFEAKADLERGHGVGAKCGCFGGGGSMKNVIVLIKGPFCFVFSNDKASSPKFAISLAHMKAVADDSATVCLETNLGDIEYEVTFENVETAKEFASAVTKEAAAGETELIRKRLGHEALLTTRKSVRYAEDIALKKVGDQPEAPVTTEELLDNLPENFAAPM